MFAISVKAHYGIAAMLDLAEHFGRGVVQIKDIVARRHIPKNYLEQIFNRLKKQGFLTSIRGSRGGYELANDPATVTVLEALEALEGQIGLARDHRLESMNELYGEIESFARKTLSLSLSDLLVKQQRHDKQIMFHI